MFAAGLSGLIAGCLNLRPAVPEIAAIPPTCLAETRLEPPQEAALSGALDGPTLRLALRDLAVILDTLGRLEQVRPDLKAQMLRDLAEADAATAAAVVKKWREKLADLPSPTPAVRTARAESQAAQEPEAKPAPAAPRMETPRPAALRMDAPTSVLVLEPPPAMPKEPPKWDELLQSLLSQTRERAYGPDPDASLARVQVAMLELLWQSEQNAQSGPPADPELWGQLAPAIEFCLGAGMTGQQSSDDTIESLQVATELLRGPGRFQARNLAFCTRIRGYGNVDRLELAMFSSSQPVLLYSEVEHFISESTHGGFRTKLSSSLELLDSNGQRVWRQDFAAVEDQNTAPRRDYFLSHSFRLPANLKSGRYAVRLTLRDELANRSASSGIALTVR